MVTLACVPGFALQPHSGNKVEKPTAYVCSTHSHLISITSPAGKAIEIQRQKILNDFRDQVIGQGHDVTGVPGSCLSIVTPQHEEEAGWYLLERGSGSSSSCRECLHPLKSNICLEIGWTVGAGILPAYPMHTSFLYPLTWKCPQTSGGGFSWQLVH